MNAILIFLIIAALIESSLATIPLSLLIIIFAAVVLRKNEVFALAFLSGLFLDILRLGTPGLSSLYFIVLVMVIFAYQKKLEVTSLNFIALVSFFSSLGYLFLISANHIIFQAAVSTIIICVSYFFFKKTSDRARPQVV